MIGAQLEAHAPPPWRLPRPGRFLRELRTRRQPPAIAGHTVHRVLEHYDTRAAGPLTGLPIGWRSDNVVVTTTSGTVVVKRYPARAARATIVHEHSITRRLAAGGFPVAPLWSGEDGQTCCAVDDRLFAVADFMPGVSLSGCYLPPTRELALYRDAGALLARFHDDLEGFRPDGHHHLGYQPAPRLPGGAADDGCLGSLERLGSGEAAGHGAEGWLVARSDAIGDAIRDLDLRLGRRQLAVGVIHGDFGLHNLTYARDGSPTVHDLELARIDRLLIDVVIVLSRSSIRCGRAFLAGYHAVRAVDGADWEALPELWQHYRLCGAVRSWQNFRDQGGERRLTAARERVEEAARVASHGISAWE